MGNGPKIVVVVLVVLVGTFVAGVLLHQRGNDTATAGTGGASDRLTTVYERWFGDVAGVDRKDLRADCFAPDTGDDGDNADRLVVQGACTLWVEPSQTRLRLVRLHTVDAGDGLTVSSRAPESDFVIEDEIGDDKDVRVAVDGEGTGIGLVCGFARTCVLTLTGEA
ncbi:hypothetical protein [Actinopolymorpha pittospori]|uniref:Uncharacterized protein n=1 Tax=Actinopolymorpha pittospori TaxID=648752 RepID=A0A927RA11_9ACTN|nr:hypothetical protein [Actinopolymorpha pittospori]MBE1604530.1 hypothetical protein [Actinopolymorpha pittospori]